MIVLSHILLFVGRNSVPFSGTPSLAESALNVPEETARSTS